jgi:hypothetical protein
MGTRHEGLIVAAEYKMVEATARDRDIWNYCRGQRPMYAVAPLKKNGSHVSGSVGGSHRKPCLHHQLAAAKLFFCGTRSKASTIWWQNIQYNCRHHCFREFNKQVVKSLWEYLAATVGFWACVTNVPIGVPRFLCRIFLYSNLHIWRPSLSPRASWGRSRVGMRRDAQESVTQNRAYNIMSILFTPAYITL